MLKHFPAEVARDAHDGLIAYLRGFGQVRNSRCAGDRGTEACKPARLSAARQAERHEVIGLDGSIRSMSGFFRSIPATSHAGKT